ncbi:helix-turn-helix domain-containing protein [Paenibacillus sp. FSL W8-1187]|uniref:helix-turn-helix domain-containing protein n=1 Tax=Paenibacillus sp. FSL W8-1187 TaxID=2975339 RepID=UPI0030DD0F9A
MRESIPGLVAGHFRRGDDYSVRRPEGADSWLLAYTLEGRGYFRTPAEQSSCSEGDLILLRKDVAHEYGTAKGEQWHFMWCHFARLPHTGLLPEKELLNVPLSGTFRRRALRSFRLLLQDARERGAYGLLRCENHLGALLLLAASQLGDRVDPRVAAVLRVLASRMEEELRIEDLARIAALSPSRLSHLFKEQTGRTILETLAEMRLEQAALLLAHAGRLPSEAAAEVGFRSYNHFAALFRRRFGVSPSAYRTDSARLSEGDFQRLT